MDKATADSLLYSLSLSLKTLDTGILLLAVFKLEIEMDYPFEPSLCQSPPASSTDTPSPTFCEGRGRLYTGYLERIIHLIIHSKYFPILIG